MSKKTGIQKVYIGMNMVDIYFDFHEINATEASLKPLRKSIRKKSNGRLFLDTLFASYGILTLKENIAIPRTDDSLSFEAAQKMIINELREAR